MIEWLSILKWTAVIDLPISHIIVVKVGKLQGVFEEIYSAVFSKTDESGCRRLPYGLDD